MEPVQLGSLRLQPFGLIFIALLIPFFVLCALQMKKNAEERNRQLVCAAGCSALFSAFTAWILLPDHRSYHRRG